MAHHGGRTVPRAHRPRAPTMSQPAATGSAPLTAPLAPLRTSPLQPRAPAPPPPPPPHVTLHAPRPDAERAANEYVETPFRAPAAASAEPHKALPPERPVRLPLPAGPAAAAAHHAPRRPVTKQPVAFTKEHPSAGAGGATGAGPAALAECAASGNIICSECGRCRCEACRAPRPLPQRWLCDNACLCSADALIDYASCLCCVKGLYYHCSDSDAGATCADEPCACGPPRRLARWACLAALAAALPCLLCYWPLRGCQRAVEAAYARHSRAGCRCRPHLPTPEKRLLDSSPDF